MQINLKTIPHSEQRYETTGDYFDEDGVTQIRVSDLGSDDYEFLVLIHEMVEWYLTQKRGIKEEDISNFDIEFENNRKKWDTSEPGDALSSPYRQEHFFATNIERLCSEQLGVNWQHYSETVLNLSD